MHDRGQFKYRFGANGRVERKSKREKHSSVSPNSLDSGSHCNFGFTMFQKHGTCTQGVISGNVLADI